MLSPRIRRLKLDHDSLFKRFSGWPVIRIVGTAGMPPELYRFQYSIRGLYVAPDGAILERNDHLLEVNLSLGYPRRAPQCRMLTPVFHPNFDDSSVCIGDFWAASESLDDLIVRIGRMISYQEYNTKSPLNGLAAKWAAQNSHLLPVDSRPIAPPLEQAVVEPASSEPTSSEPTSSEPTSSEPTSAAAASAAHVAEQAMAATIPQPPVQSAPSVPGSEDPWEQKIVIP
jgi:ubiquitin-protein ligase